MTRPLHSPSLTQTPLFGMLATERAAEAVDASAVAARDGGRGPHAETSELAGPAIGAGSHALEAAVDARRPGSGRAVGAGLGAAAGAALHFAGDDRVAPDWAFCTWLAEHHGVIAIPASPFFTDKPSRPLVRFAFCKSDETLIEACDRLAALAPADN